MSRKVEDMVEDVWKLNLDPIKVKLMDSSEGEGWSRSYVDDVEAKYRQFLILSAKYPGSSIVPTKPIDKFWHYHILDTKKYADDCSRVFGYFLHHFPYFGMRGEEDAQNLKKAFEATQSLVALEFGGNSSWIVGPENQEDGGICSTQCSEGNCAPEPSCEAYTERVDLETRPTLS